MKSEVTQVRSTIKRAYRAGRESRKINCKCPEAFLNLAHNYAFIAGLAARKVASNAFQRFPDLREGDTK